MGMNTKDVEWLGVWHSDAALPAASARWAQPGNEGRKTKKSVNDSHTHQSAINRVIVSNSENGKEETQYFKAPDKFV